MSVEHKLQNVLTALDGGGDLECAHRDDITWLLVHGLPALLRVAGVVPAPRCSRDQIPVGVLHQFELDTQIRLFDPEIIFSAQSWHIDDKIYSQSGLSLKASEREKCAFHQLVRRWYHTYQRSWLSCGQRLSRWTRRWQTWRLRRTLIRYDQCYVNYERLYLNTLVQIWSQCHAFLQQVWICIVDNRPTEELLLSVGPICAKLVDCQIMDRAEAEAVDPSSIHSILDTTCIVDPLDKSLFQSFVDNLEDWKEAVTFHFLHLDNAPMSLKCNTRCVGSLRKFISSIRSLRQYRAAPTVVKTLHTLLAELLDTTPVIKQELLDLNAESLFRVPRLLLWSYMQGDPRVFLILQHIDPLFTVNAHYVMASTTYDDQWKNLVTVEFLMTDNTDGTDDTDNTNNHSLFDEWLVALYGWSVDIQRGRGACRWNSILHLALTFLSHCSSGNN